MADIDEADAGTQAAELAASPAWYPLSVAGDRVSAVQLQEADYAAASFLDERILAESRRRGTFSLAATAAAAARLAPRSHYLFHIGHVGSTLISRLIGARPAFFSLREPALLRALGRPAAAGSNSMPLRAVLALLARTWRGEQRAVIKATSFVSEHGPRILAESEAPRAILIHARPLAYLRAILGGPNSRIEARTLAPERLRRLQRRAPETAAGPAPRSEGEWVAMSWLAEMSALAAIAQHFPAQVQWVDFDEFLGAPEAALATLFRTLGAPAEPGEIETLLAGPIMRRYSKAPEHAYDAALRREVLAAADWQFGEEIQLGLKWLESAARRDASVRLVLEAHG